MDKRSILEDNANILPHMSNCPYVPEHKSSATRI